jgi:hypothetical protein
MNDIFEKDFLSKLQKNFNYFDYMIEKKDITFGSDKFKKFIKDMEEAFILFPDDNLFFPYGPIHPPFEEKVKEFIKVAIDTNINKNRIKYRMGIMKDNMLIGCFTIDFNKHKIFGYPNETTCDPGIFIDPDYRKDNGKRNWEKVFFMATALVEKFYKFDEKEILISATTHRINAETSNILSPENGFVEFEGTVLNGEYGERRFFTISKKDFIDNFRKGFNNYQVVITE